MAWLWVGSHVKYWTDSISAGIVVAFTGMIMTLFITLAFAKRVDHAWKLVRRAAGYQQEKGALERIFVNLGRFELFSRDLLGQLARSSCDFSARTIIQGDNQRQSVVPCGALNRPLELRHKFRAERRILADQFQPHAFFLEALEFAFEVEPHEASEIRDLLVASPPIFR